MAQAEKRTESQLLRDLVELALRTRPDLGSQQAALPRRVPRAERLYVRLSVPDRRSLVDKASSARVPPATYVSMLVRSHICRVAPPLDEPVRLLRQEIRNLGTVASHLDQLTKAIDKTGRLPGSLKQEVGAMLTVSNKLRDYTRALLQAHIDSWEVGYDVDSK
jgi:hypothetical protein